MVAKAEQVDEVEFIDLSGRDVHVCLIPDIAGFKHLGVFRRSVLPSSWLKVCHVPWSAAGGG